MTVPPQCVCANLGHICDEDGFPCPHCSTLDYYDPCPVFGYGCGNVANSTAWNGGPGPRCDCCTDAQWNAMAAVSR